MSLGPLVPDKHWRHYFLAYIMLFTISSMYLTTTWVRMTTQLITVCKYITDLKKIDKIHNSDGRHLGF